MNERIREVIAEPSGSFDEMKLSKPNEYLAACHGIVYRLAWKGSLYLTKGESYVLD